MTIGQALKRLVFAADRFGYDTELGILMAFEGGGLMIDGEVEFATFEDVKRDGIDEAPKTMIVMGFRDELEEIEVERSHERPRLVAVGKTPEEPNAEKGKREETPSEE